MNLESIPTKAKGMSVVIQIDEVTALCPLTQQPDFGKLTLNITLDKKTIEQRSLRDFVRSFRNKPIWQEELLSTIINSIKQTINPRYIGGTLEYGIRGGVKVTCEHSYHYDHTQKNPFSINELLEECDVGILTTGNNISLPVNYVHNPDTSEIHIITDCRSKRFSNITNDPSVTFLIENHQCPWDKTSGILIQSTATITPVLPSIKDLFHDKYYWYEEMEEFCGDEISKDVLITIKVENLKYFCGSDINKPGGA